MVLNFNLSQTFNEHYYAHANKNNENHCNADIHILI